MIAAHVSPIRAPPSEILQFVATLTQYVAAFDSVEKREKENVEYIKAKFGYPEDDIKVGVANVGQIGG